MHAGKSRKCRLCTVDVQIVHMWDAFRAVRVHIRPFMHTGACGAWSSKTSRERSQFRQGSYVVTIPLRIVHTLGIRKSQYVRFAISKNKVIIKPVEFNITKKDMAEADRDSAALDRYGEQEDAGYMGDLAEALARRPDDAGSDRIEKLRMK